MYHIIRLRILYAAYDGTVGRIVCGTFLRRVALTGFRDSSLFPWRVCALTPFPEPVYAAADENNVDKTIGVELFVGLRRAFLLVDQEFLCAINGHMMKHPARSPHGHVFEYSTILLWLESRGRVCPFTGKPLCKGEVFHTIADEPHTIHHWENILAATFSKR